MSFYGEVALFRKCGTMATDLHPVLENVTKFHLARLALSLRSNDTHLSEE